MVHWAASGHTARSFRASSTRNLVAAAGTLKCPPARQCLRPGLDDDKNNKSSDTLLWIWFWHELPSLSLTAPADGTLTIYIFHGGKSEGRGAGRPGVTFRRTGGESEACAFAGPISLSPTYSTIIPMSPFFTN